MIGARGSEYVSVSLKQACCRSLTMLVTGVCHDRLVATFEMVERRKKAFNERCGFLSEEACLCDSPCEDSRLRRGDIES